MRIRLLIIIGILITFTITFFVLGPSQGHIAEYFLTEEQFQDLVLGDNPHVVDSIDGFAINDAQGNVKHYPIDKLDEMPCEDFIHMWQEVFRTVDEHEILIEKYDTCLESDVEIQRIKEKCIGIGHNWISQTNICELTTTYPNCSGLGLKDCKYAKAYEYDFSRYEKYYDENNDLNFGLQYDKNGIIIDDLKRILDFCDYPQKDKIDMFFSMGNNTHEIDTIDCKWLQHTNE